MEKDWLEELDAGLHSNLQSGLPVEFINLESLKEAPKPLQIEHWSLACVFAGSEARISERIGEAAYYPRRAVWKKLRGRLQNGERRREKKFFTVIPGYIFYNGDPNDSGISWLHSDKSFFGFRSIDGKISQVPNVDIHRMRMAELAGSAEVIEVFSVIVGERIEIVSGRFSGKIGIVREIEFGKAQMEFPADGSFARFSVSTLGKISFKP